MKKLGMQINGRMVSTETEPRTHLADFLRDQLFLTGTHIGCEHGVCGACTVLIDGAPARSCITYAVACDGAQVTTIEGLRDDPIIADLREAFSTNHALQCGYCTPAMLISCRDILTRLPDVDESRIRLELSGNLCRCTGYVGIVAAVKEVQKKRTNAGAQPLAFRDRLGPVGSHYSGARQSKRAVRKSPTANKVLVPQQNEIVSSEQWRAVEIDGVELSEVFRVPYSRAQVWTFFGDLEQVARCMPGARLTKPAQDGRAEGVMKVKLGPIVSVFSGAVEVERDSPRFSGIVRGAGRDSKSGSNARAAIMFQLSALEEASTQVDISVKFLLTGALAQFGRAGLVKDVADHLTQVFATNLKASLSGKPNSENTNVTLDAASALRAVLWNRIRGFFAKWM
jgi:carbon-monoxide dehydrogenase small subunit